MDYWCILRTSPSNTVQLATELCKAGFEAWTPSETRAVRVGRSRLTRKVQYPIVPQFVFAEWSRLRDLIELARSPGLVCQVWDKEERRMVARGLPYFTPFRHAGRYPRLADTVLDPLRTVERSAVAPVSPATYKDGDSVQYPNSGFEGLDGLVVGTKGKWVLVQFPRFPVVVEIDPRYIRRAQP